ACARLPAQTPCSPAAGAGPRERAISHPRLIATGLQGVSWRARGAFGPAHRHDACRNVIMAVTAAPAQDVPRVLATPPVNDFWCHLEPGAVFVAVAGGGPPGNDRLGGRVAPPMRSGRPRFRVDGPGPVHVPRAR